MAYRTTTPNAVFLVCVVSFPKQQSKSTQRSVNWSHLEEGIKCAKLAALQLKLRLTLWKGTCGGKKFSLFSLADRPWGDPGKEGSGTKENETKEKETKGKRKERKGMERKRKERKRNERERKERKGKERKKEGKEKKGKERNGKERKGT
jgi:hypothetical protein